MSDSHIPIANFAKIREKCLFCGTKLKCCLTNFLGLTNNADMPLLNAPLKNDKFSFHLSHVTDSYAVEAEGILDAQNNALLFLSDSSQNETPFIDELLAMDVFLDLKPHIELYCPKSKCPQYYTVASNILVPKLDRQDEYWFLCPPKLYFESFIHDNLWVQNDYYYSRTNIYSRTKPDADPIVVPLIDFETMGANKLLVRVQTLALFG